MAYKIVNKYLTGAALRLKSPYTMDPQYITIHNTANDAPASNEIAYMTRNSSQVGYHVAIDDVEAIQAIPFNRNAFHAGDGKDGTGNRKSIGIEICYSKSGGPRYVAAEENAIEYVAHVLHQYGWGMDRVKWHRDWSGKNCPHRILDEGRAASVRNRIAAKLAEIKKPVKEVAAVSKPTNTPSESHRIGWEWAEKKGYMNGERPKEGLTREQFASVMMKIVTDLEKK
ncbi:hypothetical protein SporoP37_01860 [Sporosarcina sp. P37]|uniref:peptidoglycan recognition protein family protein n=1 Tax=unclassified Sporosarcina TaxID=2647733 RepID=UPI000A17B35B|nr:MULTISPECIES: N-acetylmuramoyl-L-alanine amidase [unclassified Sporosarcina]ARK23561.1 hypothetical protein SporoP37_01860 [Sporosarcina sp. P37]PID18817.1 XlyB [Sporosarcina sp. P35]